MKLRLKIDPSKVAFVVLLGGQDIGNEMVAVKEPLGAKDVEDIEHEGLFSAFLSGFWPRTRRGRKGRNYGSNRRGGSLFSPFFRQGSGRGKLLSRQGLRGHGGKKARSLYLPPLSSCSVPNLWPVTFSAQALNCLKAENAFDLCFSR